MCDGGSVIGGHIAATFDLEGLTFRTGVGAGLFGGCAAVPNLELNESQRWGATLSVTGGEVSAANSSVTVSQGGNEGNIGVGIGAGFGFSLSITYTTEKIKWKNPVGTGGW